MKNIIFFIAGNKMFKGKGFSFLVIAVDTHAEMVGVYVQYLKGEKKMDKKVITFDSLS